MYKSNLSIHDYLSPDLKTMELRRMKGNIMAQWTNLLQTTGMLRMASAFVMLKIGLVCLALVGLTAGWQAISLADKKVIVLEIFKI